MGVLDLLAVMFCVGVIVMIALVLQNSMDEAERTHLGEIDKRDAALRDDDTTQENPAIPRDNDGS